jgi:pyrimidine operon attenuation protein/uracil phosphoribosyltransferase
LDNLSIAAGDIQLAVIVLVDFVLEIGRHLEAALLIQSGWAVAAKHVQALSWA